MGGPTSAEEHTLEQNDAIKTEFVTPCELESSVGSIESYTRPQLMAFGWVLSKFCMDMEMNGVSRRRFL